MKETLALLFVILGAATALAQAPAPPLIPGADGLKQSIQNFQNAAQAANQSVTPVVQGVGKIIDITSSFPQEVSKLKTELHLPQNPSLEQEAQALTRTFLEKHGLSPKQSESLSNTLHGAGDQAKKFKVLDPSSIMMAVGITAGANVLGQLTSSGKVDLKTSFGFLGDKSFWGGLVGSSIGYSLVGYALTAFLPPGGGSIVRAMLPTFGAMVGSLLGYEIGSKGFSKGLGETLKQISVTEILGQALGSTIGLFVGAHLGTTLGASLGAMAGPIGSVAGAVLLGSVGKWIFGSIRNKLTGGSSEETGATEPGPSEELPAASMVTGKPVEALKSEYSKAYQDFVSASKAKDDLKARSALSRMNTLRAAYDNEVRSMLGNQTGKHTPPPTSLPR